MGCSGSEQAQICMAWQPNWVTSWNGYGVSDGYPRFGTSELDITAGVIDSGRGAQILMKDIVLQGAITLALGCTATLVSLF